MKRFIENRPSSDTARRPLPPLAGNLLFLGALFAMSLLVMAIEKPLFLLWYHAQAAEASAAELALVVWNGLKLDQTVAGYITALPLLVVLAALWIPGRWSRSVLKGYLLVIAAVAATAFAANLALYEYWAFPLDSSVLQYLASPKEALASVTAGRRGGLRRHGVVLPARTAALRPRPAVDTSRRQHAGAAAGGRSALPADPRRGVGGNGQRLEGLFQRPDVPEPCGGQSAFLVSLDPVGR